MRTYNEMINNTKKEYNISVRKALLLTAAFFGVMLFYTLVNVALWRKIVPRYSDILNTITITICICIFVLLLRKDGYRLQLFSNINFMKIILALCCSLLFVFLLDKCLDPVFERMFPQSEQDYLEVIEGMIKSPVPTLIHVCLLAPFIEEILMRGVILGGLKNTYGVVRALFISSLLFGILHFNMVQTLSAVVCGIVLGLLYIKTDCIFCCMLAHCGYNLISYCVLILPYI